MELPHRPVVLKASGQLCSARGFGRPCLIRAQKAALRTPGDKCRAPGLCLRLSGHLSPRETPCLAFESHLHHSPREPSSGAAHLPFWAHVPAAPGPKPCRRVVPAAARPSVSALPKSPRRSGPRSPQGWGGPALGPRKRLGSAEGRPGQPRVARDASSCLDPGRPRNNRLVGKGSGGYLENTWRRSSSRGRAYLPRAGSRRRLQGAGAWLSQPRSLLP